MCGVLVLPSLHLHDERLLHLDPPTVDDHTLGVGQVPVIGVLKLDGVNYRLETQGERSPLLCVCMRVYSCES